MGATVQMLERIPLLSQLQVGLTKMWFGTTVPAGWALCTGGAVSRTTYPSLFALLGTAHGAGDGSTTFNLPDMRDRLPLGASTAHSLQSVSGLNAITLAIAQMPGWPAHNVIKSDATWLPPAGAVYWLGVSNTVTFGGPAGATIWMTTAPTDASVIRGAPAPQTATSFLRKNVAINFIIYLGA